MLRLAAINEAVFTYFFFYIYGYSSNKVIISQTPVCFHVQSTYLTVAKYSHDMEFYAVSLTF